MRDASKLGMYDAILISNVDRISRGTDEDFHYLEHWCYENRKAIVVAQFGGFQFPARTGPEGIVDKRLWDVFKETARREWEAIRDRHADTREVIKAHREESGGTEGMIGRPPFGYRVVGAKLHKTFAIHPDNGPVAHEVFIRIAQGRTATEVANWLTETGAMGGKLVRTKMVIDMIKRTSYLGSRDGVEYPSLVARELFDSANAAISARSIKTGGRKGIHGYSGVILCACSTEDDMVPLYYHHSTRDGKPIGIPHYRCARGRRGLAGETRCEYPGMGFDAANAAIDAMMGADVSWPFITVVTGGDAARQAGIERLTLEIESADKRRDRTESNRLWDARESLESQAPEPIKTEIIRRTDASVGELWAQASLTDQRSMLAERDVIVQLPTPNGEVKVA
jgi:hypothetical protein